MREFAAADDGRINDDMKIEHLALWSPDIERLRAFYCAHFGCTAGPRYENPRKGFASYFLSFPEGARLELMQRTAIEPRPEAETHGLAHFAVSVGGEAEVRALTERLRALGVTVRGEPRWTGDGYYESVIEDPDGNLIEITLS